MSQQPKEKIVPNYPSNLKQPKVVVLWSSLSSNSHQQSAQKKMFDTMGMHKLRWELLDGSQQENKDNRNKFFNISNLRGKYPQVFIVKNDKPEFIGMDDKIQEMLDDEVFDKTFDCCKN